MAILARAIDLAAALAATGVPIEYVNEFTWVPMPATDPVCAKYNAPDHGYFHWKGCSLVYDLESHLAAA